MSGLEALQSVQYVTVKGKRFAVIDANDWETLIEWLETLEDVQVTNDAYAELKPFAGDRKQASWLKWDDIKQELDSDSKETCYTAE